MQNSSPWLAELDPSFAQPSLKSNLKTDLCIIGGGFSGLISAYFILKNTNLNLVLIDSSRLGHGQTAQTTGILSKLLKPSYQDLVKLYGPKVSSYSHRITASSWKLLKQLFKDTKLHLICLKFKDYTGYSNPQDVLDILNDAHLMHSHRLKPNPIYISDSSYLSKSLEKKYLPFYKLVSQSYLNKCLKTTGFNFIAMQRQDFGFLNSALFCQKLATFLLDTYATRLQVYENTPALKFQHGETHVSIHTPQASIKASQCLFCTGSYPLRPTSKLFKSKTAHLVAIAKPSHLKPMAKTYIEIKNNQYSFTRFPYLTKNIYIYSNPSHTPLLHQKKLTHRWTYTQAHTAHSLPIAGQDKLRHRYWYNLGCSGKGSLQALASSHRISLLLAGKALPRSVFDPT